MYKILMTGMSPHLAGTEMFIMNYYRNFDSSKFQIDFVVRTEDKIIFEDEILANGSKIYRIPSKTKNYALYKKSISDFFSNYGKYYDAIWLNFMGAHNIDFLQYSKKYGIKTRIVHSHTSEWKRGPLVTFLNEFNKRLLNYYGTDFFACSEEAADYMFKGSLRKKAIVINNAIDPSSFTFSSELRHQLREQLGWQDKKIIGSVGRLATQKNHIFLIEVLNEGLKKDPDLRLVIIGEALDSNSTVITIKEKLKEYGIEDKVLLAGKQYEMKKWFSAFDVFCLPSIFEGLGIVNIEAQANGLPCVVSSVVPKMAKVNANFTYLDLAEGAEKWAEVLLTVCLQNRVSKSISLANIKNKGFDIKTEIKKLETQFLGE